MYCEYNRILGAGDIVPTAGVVRGAGEVGVTTGVELYVPRDEVSESTFEMEPNTATAGAYDDAEAACSLFMMLCRAQYFHDGNKRSALMLANHLLAHNDAGVVLTVRKDQREWLYQEIVSFDVGETSLQDAAWDLENACISYASDGVEEEIHPTPTGHRHR